MNFYAHCYRNVLWPAYEALRGRHTCHLLRKAEQRQWWSADQLREFQKGEFRKLIQHSYARSPWHRRRFETIGITPDDVHSLADLQRFPILSKDDIRRSGQEMIDANLRGTVFEHRTGGSMGVPLQFYMTRESSEWRDSMTLRGYGWAGAHDGVKVFYLWSVPVEKHSLLWRLKSGLHSRLLRREFFNLFLLSRDTLPVCLEALNRSNPVVLVGYTTMLEYLARYIQKRGGLRTRLRSVITAAEGVNPTQRALLQEAFNAPVFSSYGSREFKLIAMECERGGLHVSADNLIVECLRQGEPAAPGETGRLVITDLHNLGTPFIRYEIGDLGSLRADACSCGRGLPLLQNVQGRIPDTIQTPEGGFISGIFFPHLLKEFPWVDRFQVVQRELGRIHVKLVVTDEAQATAALPRVEEQMRSVLGNTIKIAFEFCSDIPLGPNGKHRVTLSEIPVEI